MVNRKDSNKEEDYVVEKVIDKKKVNGETYYLLKWKGYPDSDNSWQRESFLNCPELIAEFEEKYQTTKKSDRKSRETERNLDKKNSLENRRRPVSQSNSSASKDASSSSSSKKKKLEDFDDEGFHRSRSPEKIIGASEDNGELKFVMKWKGITDTRIVRAKDANRRYPQIVIDFYEERLTWHNVNETRI